MPRVDVCDAHISHHGKKGRARWRPDPLADAILWTRSLPGYFRLIAYNVPINDLIPP